jgi:UDP-GlcNAc3NAcA epimerase
MKIVTVVGARPQFIKAAAVSRAIAEYSKKNENKSVKEIIVHTGQHYDENMSNVFFDELEIPTPDYNLGIGSGSHGVQTGRMLEAIEAVLLKEKPDYVLVYGDTNSTLAGALAAVKLHIPVAHVEAGLRSFNRIMPEEINRVLTDHASDILFAPTQTAVDNLHREGISEERINLVGDVMYDAALYYGEKAQKKSNILKKLGLKDKGYILATIHRAENTDNPSRLQAIVEGFCEVSKEIPVVFPVHPRTYNALERNGFLRKARTSLIMIEPVGYLDMVMLEQNARLIATDSGGVQKEAFFYRVPCVTLRTETEWVELVELGWNFLCPPIDTVSVSRGIIKSIKSIGDVSSIFGDGDAAKSIVYIIHNKV